MKHYDFANDNELHEVMANAMEARERAAKRALRPFADDAATVYCGSDCYPATVLGKDGKILTLQIDADRIVSGSAYDGSAEYEYFSDSDGLVLNFRVNPKARGGYDKVIHNADTGRFNKVGEGGLVLGQRRRYYDPHF